MHLTGNRDFRTDHKAIVSRMIADLNIKVLRPEYEVLLALHGIDATPSGRLPDYCTWAGSTVRGTIRTNLPDGMRERLDGYHRQILNLIDRSTPCIVTPPTIASHAASLGSIPTP